MKKYASTSAVETTTAEEMQALNIAHGLKLSQPLTVQTLVGEKAVHIMMTGGRYPEFAGYALSIDAVPVQFTSCDPKELRVLPDNGEARVAKSEHGTYFLLGMGDYKLTQYCEHLDREQRATELIAKGEHNKLEGFPLEVIGQRDASESELYHIDPIVSGRYAISLSILALFMPLGLFGHDSAQSWQLTL